MASGDSNLLDLEAVTSVLDDDLYYVVRGSGDKAISGASLKAAIATALAETFATAADMTEVQGVVEDIINDMVLAPASTTENNVPQWDSVSKKLKNGLSLQTSVRASGTASNTALATEAAIESAIGASVNIHGKTDIGADLADTDELFVYDASETENRKSALSRFWTYIVGKIQALSAKTAPVDDDALTIQDSADSNALKKLSLSNLRKLGVNAQTGTTYTLVLGDQYKYVRVGNASAITLTVPPNSSVAFPIGAAIPIVQAGAGQITVAAGSGVTINKSETFKLRKQYSAATLLKIDTDEWDLIGDLEKAS